MGRSEMDQEQLIPARFHIVGWVGYHRAAQKGTNTPRHTAGSHPKASVQSQAGAAARAELRVKQAVLYLKLPFVFSLLKQKGLNSMFIIKTKLFCSA